MRARAPRNRAPKSGSAENEDAPDRIRLGPLDARLGMRIIEAQLEDQPDLHQVKASRRSRIDKHRH